MRTRGCFPRRLGLHHGIPVTEILLISSLSYAPWLFN